MADQKRWWEHYYVRYFVGTAFAVPLLALLGQREPWNSAFASFADKAWLTAGAVAFGGLAFCYIASAPILLLHAMRACILRTRMVYIWAASAIGGVAIAALITLWRLDPKIEASLDSALLLAPFTLVVLSQVYLLVYGMWRPGISYGARQVVIASHIDQARKYYTEVATWRAEPNAQSSDIRSPRTEYLESYRHLREHGNAVLILIAEVVLALALFYAANAAASLLVILLWVLPATMVWLMATWLEASIDSIP